MFSNAVQSPLESNTSVEVAASVRVFLNSEESFEMSKLLRAAAAIRAFAPS